MRASARAISIFDILGPVMTGPSSSHTAGVLRIGRMGRRLIGGDPDSVDLYFYGKALAVMYKGHLSDSAIVAGLIGHLEDSPGVKDALGEAASRGILVTCRSIEPDSDRDPNTVDMRLEKGGKRLRLVGITIGGGEILMTELDGFPLDLRGNEDGFLVRAGEDFRPEALDGLVPHRRREPAARRKDGGMLLTCLTDEPPDAETLARVAGLPGALEVFGLSSILDYRLRDPVPMFDSVDEMLRLQASTGRSFPGMAVAYESRRSGLPEREIRERVRAIWRVMRESARAGLREEGELLAGFVKRGGGAMLQRAVDSGRTLGGPVLGTAVARALAVMETNACARCVAAAPTAGSCGVVPGALGAVVDARGMDEDQAVEALLVAGIVGTLVAMRASLSGSIGGCQSEIGVASAMASAALVHLAGGTARQAAEGMALALKSVLGLICDPVAGPVEIPCIKRNAMGVANAFSSADMAIAGIESAIPPDEVIGALVNTQGLLPVELKCSLTGGLCSTPTALRLKEEWEAKMREKARAQ